MMFIHSRESLKTSFGITKWEPMLQWVIHMEVVYTSTTYISVFN